MPYASFATHCREIAENETRTISIFSDENEYDLPSGNYVFLEMFCDECDCRRVFFTVIKEGIPNPVAFVFWGWETEKFYKNWYGSSNINVKADLIGPALNSMSPVTAYSQKIVKLISTLLLSDKDYVARIKRHYKLFRQKVDGKKK
jgi:hypothetical protein